MTRVNFRLNYEVSQKRKFEQFLEKYGRELGLPLNDLTVERYWKIKEQFQASFWIRLDSESAEGAVFQMLLWANRLSSSGWSIIGPHGDKNLAFECIYSDNEPHNPLKWAHLEFEEE
ncbi:MAG: hypothetical protein HEP71_17330 [Roseivirga sp.]|nr:hypothetical protein [Roseivirga sp.]